VTAPSLPLRSIGRLLRSSAKKTLTEERRQYKASTWGQGSSQERAGE
jgi:hypothetical protein